MNESEKKTVLIIDDETSNIIALTGILTPEYDVFAAKNGNDAIQLAREQLPDLILLDVLMPDMDGYEVIAILKSSETTRSIPVIFISGLGSADAEEKGLFLGASDYISKPFNSSVVKLRVQNQIQFASQFNIVKALSLMDELTGAFNRRGFDSRLRLEWNRAMREHTPISIIMIDIDFFKKYNDEYGHLQGDRALKEVAAVLKNTLKRPADFSARWGGEEFVALLPDTDLPGTLNVAEQLRKNIEDTPIPLDDGSITKVTASLGVNAVRLSPNSSVSDFLAGADEALYAAKASGRNRVCTFEQACTSTGEQDNGENA